MPQATLPLFTDDMTIINLHAGVQKRDGIVPTLQFLPRIFQQIKLSVFRWINFEHHGFFREEWRRFQFQYVINQGDLRRRLRAASDRYAFSPVINLYRLTHISGYSSPAPTPASRM